MKKLIRPVFSLVASTLVLLPITAFRPAGTKAPARTKATEPVQVWLTTGDQIGRAHV